MRFGESILPLHVRPNDLDVLGHVNNAAVLEYLEAGRWDWLAGQGIVLGAVAAVVARAEVDYRGEIPFGPVEVRTVLRSPTAEELDDGETAYRAVFHQRVHRAQAADPAVEALITVACVDTERRLLVPLDEILAATSTAGLAAA